MSPVPLGVLDLVPVVSGSSADEALRHTVDLAQAAEAAGYRRYWFAEHHLNPGVAGSSPAVLIALVASSTRRIRLGSGGVQSGHRTALSIVEEFGLIDALHPGRLDLGVGRSGGRNFQRDRAVSARPPSELAAVPIRGRPRSRPRPRPRCRRGGVDPRQQRRGERLRGRRARLALRRQLPREPVAGPGGGRRLPGRLPAVGRPRPAVHGRVRRCGRGPDDDSARELAAGFGPWVLSIRTGQGAIPFPSPAEAAAHAWTDEDRALVADRVDTQFVGSPATVAAKLRQLQEATDADELLITTITHDHADRVRSYQLLAEEWSGLGVDTRCGGIEAPTR